MLNLESVNAVNRSVFGAHFRKPLYDSYCFSRIPSTIKALLLNQSSSSSLPSTVLPADVSAPSNVVFILLDGFGWEFIERWRSRHPFFTKLSQNGVLSKLTSQFPSTTAAHVTAMNTGLPPALSGIWEWQFYDPTVGDSILPLPFLRSRDGLETSLVDEGFTSSQLLFQPTIYSELQAAGISSTTFIPSAYCFTPYNEVGSRGALRVGIQSLEDGLQQLSQALLTNVGKNYYYLYHPDIDSAGHKFGPASTQFDHEIERALTLIEQTLFSRSDPDTLFLICADHGQTSISTSTRLYANELIPGLESTLRRDSKNRALQPAGSARDMFLYVQANELSEVQQNLARLLTGRAEVFLTDDLIAQGFFGSTQPTELFLSRVGSLALLPYTGESIWWRSGNRIEQDFKGHHGGLTPSEMDIGLMAYCSR